MEHLQDPPIVEVDIEWPLLLFVVLPEPSVVALSLLPALAVVDDFDLHSHEAGLISPATVSELQPE